MVDDAQTHLLPLDRNALDNVARLHGISTGGELIDLLQPHVDRAETLFNSLAPDREGRLSNDPDILADELVVGFADPTVPLKRIADWRSGKARSLRSPAARARRSKRCYRRFSARSLGPRPGRRDSTTSRTSSSGFRAASISIRLLEARPQLARHLALILAHASPLADMLAGGRTCSTA